MAHPLDAPLWQPKYIPTPEVPPTPWMEEETDPVRITGVRCVVTAPEGVNLVVVIVETDTPGLIGYGCATFTQRAELVKAAVEVNLGPLVTGRSVADISDLHRFVYYDSYWRGDAVLNNAIAGLDMALWDILGKRTQLPVHALLGGRVREVVPAYIHASGSTVDELADEVEQFVAAGYQFVRCQVGIPGSLGYGAPPDSPAARWNAEAYVTQVPAVLTGVRDRLGDTFSMIHDVHSRLSPLELIRFLDRVQGADVHYIEDPIGPELLSWLPQIRAASTVPLAIGELFTRLAEYRPLLADHSVDIVRSHISALGGITPALQLLQTADFFGAGFALHGPRDVSPVGHAANLALEVSQRGLVVREHHEFSDRAKEIFPGTPTATTGQVRPNTRPGLGVDFDETLAQAAPPVDPLANWHYMRSRRLDGTVQIP